MDWVNEAIEMAFEIIDNENELVEIQNMDNNIQKTNNKNLKNNNEPIYENLDKNFVEKKKENILTTEINHNDDNLNENFNKLIIDEAELNMQNNLKLNVNEINSNNIINNKDQILNDEPYYQVPKSIEPYYEVPKKQKPIPVYENIELYLTNNNEINTTIINNNINSLQPPKEKPPPPPIDDLSDKDENEINSIDNNYELTRNNSTNYINSFKQSENKELFSNNNKTNGMLKNQILNGVDKSKTIQVKRMNSTKRIKNDIRNKRSSFLGIEGGSLDDDSYLELSVAPPPDMVKLLQEERRLEKQLYMKAGLYDSSDTGESRDSGVSENHSRQSSEPFTNSSEDQDQDLLIKNKMEIIEVLEKEQEKQIRINTGNNAENWNGNDNDNESSNQVQCIEDQIREQEEVLRVEKELLQLEQEELTRQRENLIIRENLARHELQHGAKMLMSRRSLQDISIPQPINSQSNNHYANVPIHETQTNQHPIYQQVETDYRKSMSDLHQDFVGLKRPLSLSSQVPVPPAKPLRSHLSLEAGSPINNNINNFTNGLPLTNNNGLVKIASNTKLSQCTDERMPLRNYQINSALHHGGNMSRNTLLALSATPKPKFTNDWVQQSNQLKKFPIKNQESWLYQQKRKSVPDNFNHNNHWLIQEAEQRRIDQQHGLNRKSMDSTNRWNNTTGVQRNGNIDNKPLPDSVIQTLTQRVQSKGIGERKRLEALSAESLISSNSSNLTMPPPPRNMLDVSQQDRVLSVSGKKKCSVCGDELGRGAAMIIESLRLFYHIQCFKCCVCHVQLGDGLNGTDVRVRNQQLHCQNCYSSDDGIKFSCV